MTNCDKKLNMIISQNKIIMNILKILDNYAKINKSFKDYYLAAGSINQTIFNYYHDLDLNNGIKDYDIVYYDEDISYDKEDIIIKDLSNLLKDLNCCFDIKNQARVYLWYNEKYNANRKRYKSVEDAISSWTTTVTCIGVRLNNDKLKIYAPYGLEDLFNLTIRPLEENITKEIYEEKVKQWRSKWNKLVKIEWKYYYVYIIRCNDNSLYTGLTSDIKRRFIEHKNKTSKGAKYTHTHNVNKLEAVWQTNTKKAAAKLEYRIKKLSKKEKESLIKDKAKFKKLFIDKLDVNEYVNISRNYN